MTAPTLETIAVDAHDFSAEAGDVRSSSLPVDPELLPPEDRALLEIGMEDLWSSLSAQGRERLLSRLRAREAQRQRREQLRQERSALCARYIDLLCTMPKPKEPGYAAALAELHAAKAAYLAAPRAR